MRHIHERNLFGADMTMSDFLREEDLCSTIQKEVIPLMKHEDFKDMYSNDGRPPISPKVMMTVTILQYIECLSDRAAAFNLRYRIDWKIALGLEINDEGFHHSSLSYFRDRLVACDKASYAFDKVLERLVELKLVKKGAKQRIDSTHIIAMVRELSRLELLNETLRVFVKDTWRFRPNGGSIFRVYDQYQDELSSYKLSDDDKQGYIRKAGLAMRTLIEWAKNCKDSFIITKFKSYQILKKVYSQNFEDDPSDNEPKLIKIATGKDHVCSPYDSDARFQSKGGKGWLGFKAQIAETIPVDTESGNTIPNFITYADAVDATEHDSKTVSEYITQQIENGVTPSVVYADTHYNTKNNILDLSKENIDLCGPVAPKPVKDPMEKNSGFQHEPEKQRVICPQGNISEKYSEIKDDRINARFDPDHCGTCVRESICEPSPEGKRISFRLELDILADRRKKMLTKEFKEDMHKRNGIEGTISGLVRGQRMRRTKFKGISKVKLGVKMAAASANIKRMHRYYINEWAA